MMYMTVTTNAINFTASKPNIPSIFHNKIHRSSFLAGLIAQQSLSPSPPICYNSYNYPWERDTVLIVQEGGWMDGWIRKISPALGLEHWTGKPVVCCCNVELSWLHEESSAESSRMCWHVPCYVYIRQSCLSFRFSHKIFGFTVPFL